MQTFEEWLKEKETIDENLSKTLGALTLGAASLIPTTGIEASPPKIAITQSQNQQRLDAMKRVSVAHRFKKNWGSEFSQQQEEKLFDAILKLNTKEDHEDFLKMQVDHMKKYMHDQMVFKAGYHPDKNIQQSTNKQIYNSYDYQLMDYIRSLATASLINL